MESRGRETGMYGRRWASEPSNVHTESPTGSYNIKRTQNLAAKAAAQRLAQVMASQTTNTDEDDEDADAAAMDLGFRRPALDRKGMHKPPANAASPAVNPLSQISMMPPPARPFSNGKPVASLQTHTSLPSLDSPLFNHKHPSPRFFAHNTPTYSKDAANQHHSSALHDQVDMLQEDNNNMLSKLRAEEQRCKQVESRVKELEKQVAALGEGVSQDAKLLSRKEAALRQREVSVREVKQLKDGVNLEIANLRSEAKNAKQEVEAAAARLQDAENELKSFHTMTERMILTQKEMEEVVLKRCWLARYWGLASQLGICADIATSRYEHWSSLAPLPFEVVISAGQKAKEKSSDKDNEDHPVSKGRIFQDLNDFNGEVNIESMLSVEMGLKELASLQVEECIAYAFAQRRQPNSSKSSSSDFKSPADAKYMEAFELNPEESEDVLFKEAWLMYFWRQALIHGIEKDVAKERLQFWIGSSKQSPNSHDAVDVDVGLTELRKLGIERRLWEASRREIDDEA